MSILKIILFLFFHVSLKLFVWAKDDKSFISSDEAFSRLLYGVEA